jgi:two-component system OmpR family response regulator
MVYRVIMSKKYRVLIVEDEPDHLLALKLIFEGEDIEVSPAGNTREADEALEKEKIDVILLDIALPGEDGMTFCRRTRERAEYREVPIIALTAYPDQIWRDRVIEAGCTDYVGKPFEPKKLIETVRKYLAD